MEHETDVRIIGLVIAAVPVGFGVIRAATTSTDFRYLWVATVSSVAAWFMVALAWRADRRASGLVARMAMAVLAAAGAAGISAFALGAGSAPSVLIVSFGFALCSGVGLSLAAPPRAG